ncbi:hypothetical protein [Desulfobacter curvatus]|uniref:hypothetical protein n=1 Tax=Desulfobacter curvatus TaxID=2290 RepID=UPI000374C07F|nr:hypothetical protein [Desulfobacter curvatus]
MQFFKLLLKLILGAIGIIALCLIVILKAESYEIVKSDHVTVEVKKIFGKKISECSVDSNGFYNGPAKLWHLFSDKIRSEGQFQEGYWNGRWKEYDKDGHVTMIRVWNKGKLEKLFLLKGEGLIEIQKGNWPKYVDVVQQKPQRIKD